MQCAGLNALAVCGYIWWYMMGLTTREELKICKEVKTAAGIRSLVTQLLSFCSMNVEYWSKNLLREFTVVIIAAVYIPPSANVKDTLGELHTQNSHPEGFTSLQGISIKWISGTLPKFHQNNFIFTMGENTLDLQNVPHPHLGHSDHISVLLIPTYKPLKKREKPSTKNIKNGQRVQAQLFKTALTVLTRTCSKGLLHTTVTLT